MNREESSNIQYYNTPPKKSFTNLTKFLIIFIIIFLLLNIFSYKKNCSKMTNPTVRDLDSSNNPGTLVTGQLYDRVRYVDPYKNNFDYRIGYSSLPDDYKELDSKEEWNEFNKTIPYIKTNNKLTSISIPDHDPLTN